MSLFWLYELDAGLRKSKTRLVDFLWPNTPFPGLTWDMVNTFYLTHNHSGFKISTGILFILTDFMIILNDLIMLVKEIQKSLRKNEQYLLLHWCWSSLLCTFTTGQSIIRCYSPLQVQRDMICIQNRSKKVTSLFAVVYCQFCLYLCVNSIAYLLFACFNL